MPKPIALLGSEAGLSVSVSEANHVCLLVKLNSGVVCEYRIDNNRLSGALRDWVEECIEKAETKRSLEL